MRDSDLIDDQYDAAMARGSLRENFKYRKPFGDPPQGTLVMWRANEKRYSVVVDVEREQYGSKIEIELTWYRIISYTPKGVWISLAFQFGDFKAEDMTSDDKRFINFDHTKRFASASPKDAIEQFMHRRRKQFLILQRQADLALSLFLSAENRLEIMDSGIEEKW